METEDAPLKQTIRKYENEGNKKEILKIKELAGLEWDGDIEGYAQAALDRLNALSDQITKTIPPLDSKEDQINNLNGSQEILQNKVSLSDAKIKEIDHQVKEVTGEASKQIIDTKNISEQDITPSSSEVENTQEGKELLSNYTEVLKSKFRQREDETLAQESQDLIKAKAEIDLFLQDNKILELFKNGKAALSRFKSNPNTYTKADFKEAKKTLENNLSQIYPGLMSLTKNFNNENEWDIENMRNKINSKEIDLKSRENTFEQDVDDYGKNIEANKKFVIDREGEEAEKNIDMYERYKLSGKDLLKYISDDLKIDEFEKDGKTKNKKFEETIKKIENIGSYHRNIIQNASRQYGYKSDNDRKLMNRLADWLN